ncbi:hypothetical protein [Sphingobacterium sp. T2]|uniref:hypothetical protein n=1 Tax=Sphingobacterium sp. T2 TaxID=1590596 RepID=UPI00057BABF7|nr:hypothetical protein [Sphingobacterium sp. T2]
MVKPFEYFSEQLLLFTGVIFALLTVLVSFLSDILLFGSLKIVHGYPQSIIGALLNVAITLSVNIVVYFAYAKVRYRKSRLIDVSNVVLMSHIPMYVALYLATLPIVKESLSELESLMKHNSLDVVALPTKELLVLLIFGGLSLLLIVGFFYWLIIGMKIAINSKQKWDGLLVVIIGLVVNTLLQIINPFV